MPELPEVEHARRTLEPHLLGRTIARARLLRRDVAVAPGDPPGGFSRQRDPASRLPANAARIPPAALLQSAHIAAVRRHGKQLALVAEDGRALIIHFGMTGQLLYRPTHRPLRDPAHVHALWTLADDAGRLAFRDPRRFGGLWIIPTPNDLAARWAELGPDAASVSAEALATNLCRSRRAIKAALLDQTVIAGVGNIYADEALHLAKIHPCRPACELSAAQVETLATALRDVMAFAIAAGGSTIRDYVDADGAAGAAQLTHRVYGRGGERCLRCGDVLAEGTLAGRTTVWCGRCQPDASPP